MLLALVRGLKDRDIASLLGISVPTLKQHYFSELAKRRTAALRMEMRQLERLNAQAEKGNVGAEKELARRLETLRMKDQHQRSAPAPKAAAEKLGKKAEAERAAQMQRGLYEPPAAPGGLPH